LATVPANVPTPVLQPYIGDYIELRAVGQNFYGVFSAYTSLASATFPAGVTWQRNQNGTNFLDTNNMTVVQASIDPFLVRSIERTASCPPTRQAQSVALRIGC
jgi:hypothetical protein